MHCQARARAEAERARAAAEKAASTLTLRAGECKDLEGRVAALGRHDARVLLRRTGRCGCIVSVVAMGEVAARHFFFTFFFAPPPFYPHLVVDGSGSQGFVMPPRPPPGSCLFYRR